MGLSVLPKISIITPSFNQGKYLEQCIQSVMNQGYDDFEHIVIDGGSTDETLQILEKYPHVTWISEPDEGQADALNKGFSIATGTIFGWLNSDDFYAPNIFGEVADNLKDYPIIMGACELTDESGTPKTKIINKERSWFDLLKYWVPYSIPTQPSIFFTKEILELVRRTDDLLFDPELHFCMDYDLWLRIAQAFPFSHRMEETLSYYRMTPENKTSDQVEGMPYAEPEMSRIHRRYREFAFDSSYAMSVLINFETVEKLNEQLHSLIDQDFKDFECIVLLAPNLATHKKSIRSILAEWNEQIRKKGFSHFAKIVLSTDTGLGNILNMGVNKSEGRLIVNASHALKNQTLGLIARSFENNPLGVIIDANVTAIRKVILLEIDGFQESITDVLDLQSSLVTTVANFNWKVLRSLSDSLSK
jgi:hypothetical protein